MIKITKLNSKLKIRYPAEDRSIPQYHTSLQKTRLFGVLKSFTTRKSKQITDKPVKLIIKKLPGIVVARKYTNEFIPNNKRIKPFIIGYEIALDADYFEEYIHTPKELQQAILHELAHINTEIKGDKKFGHGKLFKDSAKQLGVNKIHQKRVWD
jgi:hypothetical protein